MADQGDLFAVSRCETCRRASEDLLAGQCRVCRAGVQGREPSPNGPQLNDHYIAYYARLFLRCHPEWPQAFETRNLRASLEQERDWRQFHMANPEVWRAFRYISRQALNATRTGKITARMVWEVIRLRLQARSALELGEGLEAAMRDRSLDVSVSTWSPSGPVSNSPENRPKTAASEEIEAAYRS